MSKVFLLFSKMVKQKSTFGFLSEITDEIVVYRLSPTKTLDYLRTKVSRLSTPHAMEISRTLVRGLAKDGLMEDGKDDLLKGQYHKGGITVVF
jgi:ribonuclease H2 subunit B